MSTPFKGCEGLRARGLRDLQAGYPYHGHKTFHSVRLVWQAYRRLYEMGRVSGIGGMAMLWIACDLIAHDVICAQ